jgi:hypothetical protein
VFFLSPTGSSHSSQRASQPAPASASQCRAAARLQPHCAVLVSSLSSPAHLRVRTHGVTASRRHGAPAACPRPVPSARPAGPRVGQRGCVVEAAPSHRRSILTLGQSCRRLRLRLRPRPRPRCDCDCDCESTSTSLLRPLQLSSAAARQICPHPPKAPHQNVLARLPKLSAPSQTGRTMRVI